MVASGIDRATARALTFWAQISSRSLTRTTSTAARFISRLRQLNSQSANIFTGSGSWSAVMRSKRMLAREACRDTAPR